MHIAEVVTIAKSLPLLRLNTYKSLILSYSADYRRIFNKNTTLLFYTDGITDTENQSGQFYGQDKMIRCVEAQTVKTPAFIIQALLEDIHSHIGQGNQSDDLTLLAIKYKGIPGSK